MHQGHLTFLTLYIDHWHFPVTYRSFQNCNFLLHFLWSRYNKDFLILTILLYLLKKQKVFIDYPISPTTLLMINFYVSSQSRLGLVYFLSFSTTICSQLQFLENEVYKVYFFKVKRMSVSHLKEELFLCQLEWSLSTFGEIIQKKIKH